jgi:hypothetical protein
MPDLLYLAALAAFFALSFGLVRFCAALRDGGKR